MPIRSGRCHHEHDYRLWENAFITFLLGIGPGELRTGFLNKKWHCSWLPQIGPPSLISTRGNVDCWSTFRSLSARAGSIADGSRSGPFSSSLWSIRRQDIALQAQDRDHRMRREDQKPVTAQAIPNLQHLLNFKKP